MASINGICNYIEYKNDVYFTCKQLPYLLKFNKENDFVEVVCKLHWKVNSGYTYVFLYKETIVVVSLCNCQVILVNINTMDNTGYLCDINNNIYKYVLIKEDSIIFFPKTIAEDIIIFDLICKNYRIEQLWQEQLNDKYREKKLTFFEEYDNKVFMGPIDGKLLFVYDFTEKKINTLSLPFEEEVYGWTIAEGKVFFTSRESCKIYIIDLKSKDYCKIEHDNEEGYFAKPLFCRDRILLFSKRNMYYLSNNKLKMINCSNDNKGFNTWFLTSKDYETKTLLLPWTAPYFSYIDWDNNRINTIESVMSDGTYLKLNSCINENDGLFSLVNYLNALRNWEY